MRSSKKPHPGPVREAHLPVTVGVRWGHQDALAYTPGGQCPSSPPALPQSQARPGRTHHLRPVATDLVNPELAHDDVVNGGGDFPPDVVIPAGVKLEVDCAWGERGAPSSARADSQAGLQACTPGAQGHPSIVLVLGANRAPPPASPIIGSQPGLGLDSSLPLLHTPWSAAVRELQQPQGPLPSSHPLKSTNFKSRSETCRLGDSQCHKTSQAPAQL